MIRRLAMTLLCGGLQLTPAAAAEPSGAAAMQPLSAVGDNWCPYNCDPVSGTRGYIVDLLDRILGKSPGLLYRLEPWTRALHLVERGDHQLLIGTTPSGSPKLKLSVPVGVDRTCFYVRSDSPWRYKRPDDLKAMRIGVIQDYSYDADGAIDKLIASYRKSQDARLELAYGDNALTSNFRKLAGGRMDVVIENENVARYTLQQMHLNNRIVTAGCATHYLGTLHVGLSPKLPNATTVAAQIERGIAELRRSGELDRILASYGLQDWHQSLASKTKH